MAALAVVGGLISGVTSFMQMSAQASIADANAQQARLDAEAANQKGQTDTQDIGQQSQGELGGIYASEGASGFGISSPSFASGRAGFLTRSYTSELRTQDAANRQEANYKTESNIYKATAANDRMGAILGLAGGVVGGFSNARGNLFASANPIMGADYIPLPSSGNQLGNTGPMPALATDLVIG